MRHGHIGKMGVRARADPERHSTASVGTEFKIVDDQRRLFLVVKVETGGLAFDADPQPVPITRSDVCIALISAWVLDAQPLPIQIR